MSKNQRAVWIYGFTLFSLFFGAGNLILPPQIGLKAGADWWWVTLGFCISGVFIPMLGILAHARLQDGILAFGRKISKSFSLWYAIVIYAVALSLPAPRTAAVTHEMAVMPYWDIPSWVTSILYFAAVFAVAINRSKIASLLGKWLSPALLIILILLILNILFKLPYEGFETVLPYPFANGILEGYQTFDAIGSVVAGGVILISLRIEFPNQNLKERRKLIIGAASIAGIALMLLYAGLIRSGVLMHDLHLSETSRTDFLLQTSVVALGNLGAHLLGLLFALACFTTAVGIITGTADFVKELWNNSEKAFRIAAGLGSLLGVLMGQLAVSDIIDIAFPVLQLVYPLTIVLIGLHVLPKRWASPLTFKVVVLAVILSSIPEFLGAIGVDITGIPGWEYVPLQQFNLGWVVPTLISFFIVQLKKGFK